MKTKKSAAPLLIRKSSGEQEPFNINKFTESLRRVGANQEIIDMIADQIGKKTDIETTRDVYSFAFKQLKKHRPAIASRYRLKQALFEMGPSGFPFEEFVARIFEAEGFKVKTDVMVPGLCVEHEVDIVAHKSGIRIMGECKFHVRPGIKSNVKIPLYVRARFNDIKAYTVAKKYPYADIEPWLITNTEFTSEAIAYGECAGLSMLGWGYPRHKGIERLIDQHCLYPITCLTTLTKAVKNSLLQEKIVVCSDLAKKKNILKKYGILPEDINKILAQAEEICQYNIKK